MTPEQIQLIIFFALWVVCILLLAGPILVLILYGRWSKWILLAIVAMLAFVSAASIGYLTPQ